MKKSDLAVGTWYNIKYRPKAYYDYWSKEPKVITAKGQLKTVCVGTTYYGQPVHKFKLENGKIGYASSGNVISVAADSAILPDQIEKSWEETAKAKLEKAAYDKDLTQVKTLLKGLGIKSSIVDGALKLEYIDAVKMQTIIEQIYVQLILGEE